MLRFVRRHFARSVVTFTLALTLSALSPTIGRAYSTFEFEAWPTAASDTCGSLCYQVRMFLQDDDPSLQRKITALQMGVDVVQGAVPASLPTPPVQNANAGPGALQVRDQVGTISFLPWNLSSTVGKPALDFDVLMVHAASEPFTVASLKTQLFDPNLDCIDNPAKCDLVKAGIALNRIYLGFFNVVRTDALPGGGTFCLQPGVPELCVEGPEGPYFVAQFGEIYSLEPDDLLDARDPFGNGLIAVPFLPEPYPGLMLAGLLLALVPLRLRSRPVCRVP